MAPKKNNEDRGRRSKTPGQTSASDPNPTVTSPTASAPTGDATTASLVPSSASPSAPPTTTTQLIPSAPPQTTTLLPSSPPHLTATTQPLSSAPPLPIRKTHQEPISCTSDGATTTDLAGPSIAPSASAGSMDDFMSLFATVVQGVMASLLSAKEDDLAALQVMLATSFGLRLDDVESLLDCLLGLAEKTKSDAELEAALEALGNVEALKRPVKAAEMILSERKKWDGSGGSCGGSKGAGGGPDSGSGEGDGEGGGVSSV